MSDGPNIWDVSEDITIEVFVADPDTGLGLSGQSGFITLTIKRDSDEKYWTGSAWSDTLTNLTTNETDETNEPGRYNYVLSGSAGNVQADRYVAHAKIDNSPTIEGDSYEVHVSRITAIRLYESEGV